MHASGRLAWTDSGSAPAAPLLPLTATASPSLYTSHAQASYMPEIATPKSEEAEREAQRVRHEQLAEIARFMQEQHDRHHPGLAMFLAGDFNIDSRAHSAEGTFLTCTPPPDATHAPAHLGYRTQSKPHRLVFVDICTCPCFWPSLLLNHTFICLTRYYPCTCITWLYPRWGSR